MNCVPFFASFEVQSRTSDLGLRTAVRRQVRQCSVQEGVIPQLRGRHGGKANLHGESAGRAVLQPRQGPPPELHPPHVEEVGSAQGFLAQQLADKRGRPRPEEEVVRGAEHRLGPAGDQGRQPDPPSSQQVLGEPAEKVLVAETAQFPARGQAGQERDQVLVQEGIARLDGGVHGHAVAAQAEQQAGQVDSQAEVERLVERVPAAQPRQVQPQVGVGDVPRQGVAQPRAIEVQPGDADQAV
jgi:hypothetical protein